MSTEAPRVMKRRLSFTSELFVRGTFSTPNEHVQAVISIVCFLEEIPDMDTFRTSINRDLLSYSRFGCAVDTDSYFYQWYPVQVTENTRHE